MFKVFLTSALPNLVSKGDELIFSRRIFFIPPGVGAGKSSLPFGYSVVEQQIVAGGLVLVTWAREFIRVKRLAYVVSRGAKRHGVCVEAQLRPRRREFFYELPGHFVHGTQVRSETRGGINFGEQLDDLIRQRAEVH